MPSTAEQICSRIQALLTGTTSAGTAVWRDRDDALDREESPAILIEASTEDTETLGGHGHPLPQAQVERNTLTIMVTTCVRGQGWQQTADAVRLQAHALLMADPVLRTLATGIRRTRCEWQSSNADLPFGYASQAYQITYTSRAHALDAT